MTASPLPSSLRTLPRSLFVPSFVNANTFCGVPFPLVGLRRVLAQSCIGFTKKQDNQIKQTCYAQASQIRAVRKKMCDIMSEEASKCDLRELVLKL